MPRLKNKISNSLMKKCKKYTIKKNGNKIKFKCDNTPRLKFGECGCNKNTYFGSKKRIVKINKIKIYKMCRRYGINTYKPKKVGGRKVRKNIIVLVKACLKHAKSRLKKSKSKSKFGLSIKGLWSGRNDKEKAADERKAAEKAAQQQRQLLDKQSQVQKDALQKQADIQRDTEERAAKLKRQEEDHQLDLEKKKLQIQRDAETLQLKQKAEAEAAAKITQQQADVKITQLAQDNKLRAEKQLADHNKQLQKSTQDAHAAIKQVNIVNKLAQKFGKKSQKFGKKSQFGKTRTLKFGYTLNDLKKVLIDSGNQDDDRTLNTLYRLCVDEGVYSQYVPLLHSFLKDYGNMKARDIMKLSQKFGKKSQKFGKKKILPLYKQRRAYLWMQKH
jgi:hypothetical protein